MVRVRCAKISPRNVQIPGRIAAKAIIACDLGGRCCKPPPCAGKGESCSLTLPYSMCCEGFACNNDEKCVPWTPGNHICSNSDQICCKGLTCCFSQGRCEPRFENNHRCPTEAVEDYCCHSLMCMHGKCVRRA